MKHLNVPLVKVEEIWSKQASKNVFPMKLFVISDAIERQRPWNMSEFSRLCLLLTNVWYQCYIDRSVRLFGLFFLLSNTVMH